MPKINPRTSSQTITLTCPRCQWTTTPMTASRARFSMASHVGADHPDVAEGRRADRARERETFRREHVGGDGAIRRGGARVTDGIEHPVTTRRIDSRS